MISRWSSGGGRSFRVGAPLGALLTLLACSSSGDTQSAHANTDGGDGGQATPDAGNFADAGETEPPPPYDFAVTCTADPCVTQIAARGGTHACAVLQDGSVRCWGSNASGQLGTGDSDGGAMAGYEATPRRVLDVSKAKSVAATGDGTAGTTCIVSGPGDVACFGSNAWGQLGRGAGSSNGPNPTAAVVERIQAKSVTLTSTFALAIGTDDRLWSWGTDDAHQLARDVSDAGSATAASIADRIANPVRACAGTFTTGFVVAQDGSLLSWGGGTFEQLGRLTSLARDPVPAAVALSGVSSVTAGAAHACALGRGSAYCWGKNERGQLGTGRKAEELFPARVVLPGDVYPVAVAAGENDTCIIAASGDVYCWGANAAGQLGTSSGLDEAMPVRIDGLAEQTVALAVMDQSICALLRGGSITCWGDNLLGQLGRGRRDLESHPQPSPVVFE
jgi:alpha-tubulin suppressor-like RCC1 family protein